MVQSQYERSVIPVIESTYSQFTPVERNIADFFIKNTRKLDFSARNIAKLLFVSEASLSRFSQKCGFSGYREFLFHYQNSFSEQRKPIDGTAKDVLGTYQELLNKSFALIDEAQVQHAVELLGCASKVYAYGMGSSGLTAQELKLRFMRLGLDVEAISDSHVMKLNSVLLRPEQMLIGISISGETNEIINALRLAKKRGASTLLITSNNDPAFQQFCDEVLLIGVTKNLSAGNVISPQFPALIMVDLLFANYLNTDYYRRTALYTDTLSALRNLPADNEYHHMQ